MKSKASILITALFLLISAVPQSTTAQTAGTSASGSYRFILEDDLPKYVEFDVRTDDRGNTSGYMVFNDTARISDRDTDGDDNSKEDMPPEFYIKADISSMTVEKNKAVMGGTVLDSSHRTYIGRWVQLVVEDNISNLRLPDTLTWGFCRQPSGGWVPSDAERKYDDGAYLSWWATDAERRDDVGVPSRSLISNDMKGCQVYPPSFYTFVTINKWEGDIKVNP
jgi:hypothetical protein